MTSSRHILHDRLDQLLATKTTDFSDLCGHLALDIKTCFIGRTLKDFDFRGSDIDGYIFLKTSFVRCWFDEAIKGSANFCGATFFQCIDAPTTQEHDFQDNFVERELDNPDDELAKRWAELLLDVRDGKPVYAQIKSFDDFGIKCSVMGFDGLLPWSRKTRVFEKLGSAALSTPLHAKATFSRFPDIVSDPRSEVPVIGTQVDLGWPYTSQTVSEAQPYPAWGPNPDKSAQGLFRAQVRSTSPKWIFLKSYDGNNQKKGERVFQVARESDSSFRRLLVGQIVECKQRQKEVERYGSKNRGNITISVSKTLNMWHSILRNWQKKQEITGTLVKHLPNGDALICIGGAIAFLEKTEYHFALFPDMFKRTQRNLEISLKLSHFDDNKRSLLVWISGDQSAHITSSSNYTNYNHLIELKALSSTQVSAKMEMLTEDQYR
jgi:hypothetical protein